MSQENQSSSSFPPQSSQSIQFRQVFGDTSITPPIHKISTNMSTTTSPLPPPLSHPSTTWQPSLVPPSNTNMSGQFNGNGSGSSSNNGGVAAPAAVHINQGNPSVQNTFAIQSPTSNSLVPNNINFISKYTNPSASPYSTSSSSSSFTLPPSPTVPPTLPGSSSSLLPGTQQLKNSFINIQPASGLSRPVPASPMSNENRL
jgi:hypothetical protein